MNLIKRRRNAINDELMQRPPVFAMPTSYGKTETFTLIKEAFAALRSAEAGYPVVAVPFSFKFIIVREFLV